MIPNPVFPQKHVRQRAFVGFGESVGDILTYKILVDDMNKIIYRSYVQTALSDKECNARLNPTGGETKPIVEVMKSPRLAEGEPSKTSTINFAPDDLTVSIAPT